MTADIRSDEHCMKLPEVMYNLKFTFCEKGQHSKDAYGKGFIHLKRNWKSKRKWQCIMGWKRHSVNESSVSQWGSLLRVSQRDNAGQLVSPLNGPTLQVP